MSSSSERIRCTFPEQPTQAGPPNLKVISFASTMALVVAGVLARHDDYAVASSHRIRGGSRVAHAAKASHRRRT